MLKKKSFHFSLLGIISFVFVATPLFLWFHTSDADNHIVWGVNFSESQAEYLGLDPKETYSAIIHDLKAKRIKLHINWNATEVARNVYDFSSLDYQVAEAEKNNVQLILVIGMKTGRWPECHTPEWFAQIREDERKEEIIRYVRTLAYRYKDSPAVEYWQIENEPFLEFGTCPDWYYEYGPDLVADEIAAIRTLDPERKIIVSESGELSDWTTAAELADIVGVTMYRSTYNETEETFGLNPYTFLAPQFYSAKAAYIQHAYNKPVISIELQAEPWTAKPLKESKLEIQAQSMNPKLFKENIVFARQAGLGAYYFWGAEWWYWMKNTHNQPEIWDEAATLFTE
jgi:Cellulase (glycosyl hydrolase family 5)